jgi:asparagine synthase (glutamine-hydrolysing)
VCGINGIYYFYKDNPNKEAIAKMNKAIAHRGPDNLGEFHSKGLSFGHVRLSIIDLSENGNQPFVRGNVSLVFNGEIYNYKSLKSELSSDFNFTSNTDTEVIIAAYHKWGINLLSRLRGMFAFALYDQEKNQLFVARDRFGIKPLYYQTDNEKFIFSSELKGILSSGLVQPKINNEVLGEYIRYQTVLAPNTIIEEVKMLMPGHYFLITPEEFSDKAWYNPLENAQKQIQPRSRNEALKKVAENLSLAMEDRLVADVPVGAFLSGGIDSSLLVALASKLYDKKLDTFHISFAEEEFSEAKFASSIAKKYNTNHTDIKLSPVYFLEHLEAGLEAMDFPSADGLNTYMVSKATAETGVKVALSGLGGDEVFAGYDIFNRAVSLKSNKWLNSFPIWARGIGGALLKKVQPSIKSDKISQVLSEDYFDVEYLYKYNREVLNTEIVKSLTVEPNALKQINSVYNQLSAMMGFGKTGYYFPITGKVSMAEITTYLQNILLRDTDQMSMAHALEVRVPFLDHRLVESVIAMPDEWKLQGDYNKSLLIDAFPNLLPEEVYKRTKQGFTLPYEKWMRNELKPFCDQQIEFLGLQPYFNAAQLNQLYQRFTNNDAKVTWSRIWHLVVLGSWLRKWS